VALVDRLGSRQSGQCSSEAEALGNSSPVFPLLPLTSCFLLWQRAPEEEGSRARAQGQGRGAGSGAGGRGAAPQVWRRAAVHGRALGRGLGSGRGGAGAGAVEL